MCLWFFVTAGACYSGFLLLSLVLAGLAFVSYRFSSRGPFAPGFGLGPELGAVPPSTGECSDLVDVAALSLVSSWACLVLYVSLLLRHWRLSRDHRRLTEVLESKRVQEDTITTLYGAC